MRKSSLVAVLVVGALLVPLAVFASHSVNDAPNSHTFHNSIDWMKDRNITVGCNPPANTNFCPNDTVTRGQMSAFMKRLAENNVVDAATLDGRDGVAYQTLIWGAGIDYSKDGQGTIDATLPGGDNVLNLNVSPPATGVLALTYNLEVFQVTATPFGGRAWLQYDNTTCNWDDRIDATSSTLIGTSDSNFNQVSMTVAKSTTAGGHVISLCGGMSLGTSVTRNDAGIVATFSAVGVADQ